MTNGYIMVTRDRETSGIHIETTYYWRRYMDEGRRMIYCQAVSDVDTVQEKIDRWLEENQEEPDVRFEEGYDINDKIAEMVSAVQWIGNEHPLRCFRIHTEETSD